MLGDAIYRTLADFIAAMSPERIVVTILAAVVFGFGALGSVMNNKVIALALGEAQYGKAIAKAVFLVAMMFSIPQVLLSFVNLDGPTGRALAAIPLWGLFCLALDFGIRLRIKWTVHRKGATP